MNRTVSRIRTKYESAIVRMRPARPSSSSLRGSRGSTAAVATSGLPLAEDGEVEEADDHEEEREHVTHRGGVPHPEVAQARIVTVTTKTRTGRSPGSVTWRKRDHRPALSTFAAS